jgi:hypothetical protein
MKRTFIVLSLTLAGVLTTTLPAAALDGCPRGEWATSCALCLPGWHPAATGHKNAQGQACYACFQDRSAADSVAGPICAEPITAEPFEGMVPQAASLPF